MAFTPYLKITPNTMTGSVMQINFPAGCSTHLLQSLDGAIGIQDDDGNEFTLSQYDKLSISDPNLSGGTLNVVGTAGHVLQMISQFGNAS